MGKKIEDELKEICQLLMEGKLSFEQLKQKMDIYLEKNSFLDALVKLYSKNFLQYASEELRNNEEFILLVCNYFYFFNFQYASEELKNDKDLVFKLCRNSGYRCFQYASNKLRNDKEFVLNIFDNIGDSVLKYIGEELKNDKDLFLRLCCDSRNYYYLQYAGERIRNDKEFIFELCKLNYRIFQYASEILKNDREYIERLIAINYCFIKYTKYNDDKEWALKLIKKDYKILFYLSERLRNDEEIVLEAMKQDEKALYYAGEKIKTQKKYVIKVFKNNNDYYFAMLNKMDIPHYNELYSDLVSDKDVISAALSSDKLVKFFYKKYYQNFVSNLEDKNKDNIYDFVKYCLTNKDIILNLYYPYGINNEVEVGLSRLNVFFEKEVENKFKIIRKEVSVYYRGENVKIYNEIIKNKDDTKKLGYILNKNKFNQNNIYDFIINNKYLDKQMKEALYNIVEIHYGKAITVSDIIDLINTMLDNELSSEEMFRDNVVLKEKLISKKLFYRIYNDALESNPFLHNYIKNAFDVNKRRGFKKILRLGNIILSSDFNSLDEYNAKFPEYSPIKVLKMLKGTDLYPKLLEMFKNIDGIDLGEEFDEPKSRS